MKAYIVLRNDVEYHEHIEKVFKTKEKADEVAEIGNSYAHLFKTGDDFYVEIWDMEE